MQKIDLGTAVRVRDNGRGVPTREGVVIEVIPPYLDAVTVTARPVRYWRFVVQCAEGRKFVAIARELLVDAW